MAGGLLGSPSVFYIDGGIPLSVLPEDTASECAGLFSPLTFCAQRQARKL